MRTLKKTLCLVLSVVMVLGLCTFGVNAAMVASDYSDGDKITHTQAVDILGTIGVLNGMPDGGFEPDGTLKRGEATKIITTMLGVNVPTAKADFVDTAGHWAESYIAYCAAQGIVAGTDLEAKTFNPDDTLTGGAFAKMLLTALGYDAEIETLLGKLAEVTDADSGL